MRRCCPRLLGARSQCRQTAPVPAAYTSQTCPVCGHVNAANRQSQAEFVCVACGHAANADTNAAINILRRADSALKPVEEHRAKRPDEAGTSRRKAA